MHALFDLNLRFKSGYDVVRMRDSVCSMLIDQPGFSCEQELCLAKNCEKLAREFKLILYNVKFTYLFTQEIQIEKQ